MDTAASVAQLVGVDAGSLISMIMQAALTARRNNKECEQLVRRVLLISELLPLDSEALGGLDDTLREAYEVVASCQGRSAAYKFFMAGRIADRFRDVQSRIDLYINVFPLVSHIGRLSNALLPGHTPPPPTHQFQLLGAAAAQGAQEFKWAEIVVATNKFDMSNVIGRGAYATVYMRRLENRATRTDRTKE